MTTAASLVEEARDRLAARGVSDPGRDAELLLARVLDVERPQLHLRPDSEVGAEAAARFRLLVSCRAEREPLQYLLGEQEFWSLPFKVTPAVLIPRPETEHLVETLLRETLPPEPLLLDLGTGSGCLAVAAAHELKGARVVATDVSEEALLVARGNALRNGVLDRITFLPGDLFDPLERFTRGGFDAILSNPPYIGDRDLAGLEPEVRDHEPRRALSPGPDALLLHRRIAAEALAWLRPGGRLILEIGAGQEEALKHLYAAASGFEDCQVMKDLAGIPRVLSARRSA